MLLKLLIYCIYVQTQTLPVREFGTVCHVACEHLTSATDILKHY